MSERRIHYVARSGSWPQRHGRTPCGIPVAGLRISTDWRDTTCARCKITNYWCDVALRPRGRR